MSAISLAIDSRLLMLRQNLDHASVINAHGSVHISVAKAPLTDSRRSVVALWREKVSMTGQAAGLRRPPRILRVEDEELLAAVIADVLGDSHDVVCAPNVGDAIDHLLGDAIDFVLLDCVLPDGLNWQVALEADRQAIPVVFMTGDAGQAEELVEGTRPYLLKPFAIATLITVVDKAARPLQH